MNSQTNDCWQGMQRLGLDQPDVRVLVVGLGVTGLSVVRFLSRAGIEVAVVDSRELPPGLSEIEAEFPDVAVFVGEFSGVAFNAATHLVVSPGVSLQQPMIQRAAERGVPVLGDIDLFAVCVQSPVLAITGSNGKSTVTTLLGDMLASAELEVRLGGNLGTPALDLLGPTQPDYFVLELSSFQLERTSHLKAAVSVFLNISADHLDHHAGFEAYLKAKLQIFHGDGVAVLNRDDALVMASAPEHRRQVTFGLDEPSSNEAYGVSQSGAQSWLVKGNRQLCAAESMKLRGSHNHANALACLAVIDALDIQVSPCMRALQEFTGLSHRMEWVAETEGGVEWINDSKATNPGAAVAAISGLSSIQGQLLWIAGGDGKGADFEVLREPVSDKVRAAILMGQDAKLLRSHLPENLPVEMVGSIEQAVQQAASLAQPGDVVLLSPACASLDQYNNYQERGDRFRRAVEGLINHV